MREKKGEIGSRVGIGFRRPDVYKVCGSAQSFGQNFGGMDA